jgi:3-(3-hydroxy-phenyl)propionate hydroxylase
MLRFTLLLFSDETAIPDELARVAADWGQRGLGLHITTVPSSAADGQAWARFGVRDGGAAYLVRPDQHVSARWLRVTAHRLDAALHRAHGL